MSCWEKKGRENEEGGDGKQELKFGWGGYRTRRSKVYDFAINDVGMNS